MWPCVQAALIALGWDSVVWNLAAATLVAGLAGALVSVLSYEWIFRRLSRAAMVASLLASIGLAFLVRSLITLVVGHDQRTFALPLMRAWNFDGIRVLPTDLALAAVALITLAGVFAWLHLGRSGRLLRAIADNPDLARMSGIRSRALMWRLWALAGLLAGVGGVLLGVKSVVMPELGWELLLPAFAAMILGGIGSPGGAVAGALLMGVGQEVSIAWVGPSYKIAVSFLVLFVVLMLRPAGLFGRMDKVR